MISKTTKLFTALIIMISLAGLTSCKGKKDGAADFPKKPITIIVPSKAGGGTDTMARLIAQSAKKYTSQPFVIVNKPGAGGQIGFDAISRSKKDGYTIGAVFTPHLTAHISADRAGYTLEDFSPIANVVTDPGVLVVPAASPFKSIQDIIDAETKNPGSLTGSTQGAGSDDFFALVKFNTAASLAIRDVPSKGSSDQKAQVLGGHVDMAFMNFSQVESNVNAGDLRLLAVMSPERLPYADQYPTFKEAGVNIVSDSSRGFVAPAGIPEEAYTVLVDIFTKVLNDAEFKQQAKGQLLLNLKKSDAYSSYLKEVQATTDQIFADFPW